MALDKDGSIIVHIDAGNVIDQLSGDVVNSLNNESDDGIAYFQNVNERFCVLFPEKRDVAGIFVAYTGDAIPSTLMTSVDTTTGIDGTWVLLASSGWAYSGPTIPNYRTAIYSVAAPGIRGIRWAHSEGYDTPGYIRTWHLYGVIHAGENPDRLALWHPTLDEQAPAAYFDWGDVPRDSTADRTFRVKNLSSTLTASTITGSTDAMTDTTPTVVGQHMLSTDGTTFTSTITIPDLAPGAISGVLTLRRTTPSDAVLSVWDLRLSAVAASWA
jgi:hypothetical protein